MVVCKFFLQGNCRFGREYPGRVCGGLSLTTMQKIVATSIRGATIQGPRTRTALGHWAETMLAAADLRLPPTLLRVGLQSHSHFISLESSPHSQVLYELRYERMAWTDIGPHRLMTDQDGSTGLPAGCRAEAGLLLSSAAPIYYARTQYSLIPTAGLCRFKHEIRGQCGRNKSLHPSS